MARRYARRRAQRPTTEEYEVPAQELSLEEILEEYRAQQAEEAAAKAAAAAAESEPVRVEPDGDDILTGELPTEEPVREETPTRPEPEAAPAEETPSEPPKKQPPQKRSVETAAKLFRKKAKAPLQLPPEEAEDDDLFSGSESGASDVGDALSPAENGSAASTAPVPTELLEGYEDEDDFYAGVPERPAPQEDEPSSFVEEAEERPESDEDGTADESDDPDAERKNKTASRPRRPGPPPNPFTGLRGKIAGLAAAASIRREQRRTQPPPEPEDAEKEMEPRKAARHYAAQMPSLRIRAVGAVLVCLLLSWITLSASFGWPLPGGLENDYRRASLVCLAGEITVMLLGLDIATSGFMSLLRGRPGAESLIVLAGIASVLDTAALIITGNADRGLPYTVVPAAAMTFALWGAWLTGRGYYDSFMTFFHIKDPTCVSAVELSESDGKGLISSRRDTKGFIRRSEEPGPAESISGAGFIPMALGALALSLALAVGSGDAGAFFHIFSLMTGLLASFGWLFIYPMLFAKTARHLMLGGAVVAGWTGAREIGRSGRLVLSDSDIYPAQAMEITGIRIMDKLGADTVISLTGSILATAGTGSAAVFTELMRRHNAALQQVEDFAVGEGGARGTVGGKEVRVGTAGFMHLSAVKIPDKVKAEDALYTAVDGELAGVFLFRYRPMAEVQRALFSLRNSRRKPVFAIRDFNIDPMQLRRAFGVSTEGFRFPTFPERYRLSALSAEESSPVAGVVGFQGLEGLVDLYESGRSLFRMGRLCAWICLASAVLGVALAVVPCWLGSWSAVSAGKILIYMLLWVIPGIVGAAALRK